MMRRYILAFPRLLLAFQTLAVLAFAEQLPVKTYTTADGLPRDEVSLVKQDSRGFLWVVAGDGISRFDGYKFRNYTTDDGLADRRVNDFLETKSGAYWIATEGGLCRFNPEGRSNSKDADTVQHGENSAHLEPMFVVYNPTQKPMAFNVLWEDETGAIWCGTSEGLYRLDVNPNGAAKFQFVELSDTTGPPHRHVGAILKDRRGALWCGVGASLDRLLPDGRIEHYSKKHGLSHGVIISLLEDSEGNIWAGTQNGISGQLLRLVRDPDLSVEIVARMYGVKDGLAGGWIRGLEQTSDGKLWAATLKGLYAISPAADASTLRFQLYDATNGLCTSVSDVAADRDGNLWIASACGVQKISHHGFTGYGVADGLGSSEVNSIFEDRDGALFVISKNHGERIINKLEGARFHNVKPNLPPNVTNTGWGWGQTIIEDHLGEWWIPGFGLYRFPKVKRFEELGSARGQFVRTMGGDYDQTETFRLYEDSRGDVWIAKTGTHYSLLRWERTTSNVDDFTAATGVPPTTDFTAFCEDHAGNLWIGTGEGGVLLRYRDGKFQRFTSQDGVPAGWIIGLYLDRGGRLWIASQLGGLNRIDALEANALSVTMYTTVRGLSSNNIRSITEDEWGRIYVGTGHGVDRLDLETGGVKHFTAADGLPKGTIEHAFRDRNGVLWFGSQFGLSQLIPKKQGSFMLPSVYVTGLRIEGVARPVSELGATDLPTLDLASNQRQVGVDFVGLGASLGEELRYQYSLENSNDVWSAPTTERTINFASLAPGTYRFRVRAVDAEGSVSSNPATFILRIASPIWHRSWFLLLTIGLIGLAIYCVYRFRLNRLLELERVRTRIATDLHDDVGSGLSQVSILSEVIRRRVGNEGSVGEELSLIGTLSRDLVDSMSDIVWAINPVKDRLSDLSYRMRRMASDVFTAHGVDFVFDIPNPGLDIKLGPEMRRELYLIFKETVHNVVHHSRCTLVKISFVISDGALELSVHDNGQGFDPDGASEGNGLANMQMRAEKLGGVLRIGSTNSHGTTVNLKVQLDGHRRFWSGLKRNRSH